MAYAGVNYGKITNRPAWSPAGGGGTVGKSPSIIRVIQRRASDNTVDKNTIFMINQLSGIGRHQSQFVSTADGVNRYGLKGPSRGNTVAYGLFNGGGGENAGGYLINTLKSLINTLSFTDPAFVLVFRVSYPPDGNWVVELNTPGQLQPQSAPFPYPTNKWFGGYWGGVWGVDPIFYIKGINTLINYSMAVGPTNSDLEIVRVHKQFFCFSPKQKIWVTRNNLFYETKKLKYQGKSLNLYFNSINIRGNKEVKIDSWIQYPTLPKNRLIVVWTIGKSRNYIYTIMSINDFNSAYKNSK